MGYSRGDWLGALLLIFISIVAYVFLKDGFYDDFGWLGRFAINCTEWVIAQAGAL